MIKILILIFLLFPSQVWAGGAVNRQQGVQDLMKQQAIQAQQKAVEEHILKQQQEQKQMYEQAVRQRQKQQEVQAYEQAVRRQQLQQQEYAIRQRKQQEEQRAYQEAIERKKMLEQKQGAEYLAAEQAIREKQAHDQYNNAGADPGEAEDVVGIKDVWQSLQNSSEVWPLIIEDEPKMIILQKYVTDFQEQGVTIKKPLTDYAKMLDHMIKENPELLKKPLKDLLKTAAIIEYDFDNGQSKDQMALKLLGSRGYFDNRKRLGFD